MFKACVDTGGTFTDCVVIDDHGKLLECKAPTTPSDRSLGVIDSLREAGRNYNLSLEEFAPQIQVIVHGTTTPLNAFITRTGAKTALITTRGFRDIIEIRRAYKNIRHSMYEVFIPPYEPLVPRYLRFGVDERVRYNGEVIAPLNEPELREIIRKLKAENIESVAICFIHSFANPVNEKRAAEICREELKDVYICTSSEVIPIIGEFARESTTILNAYLGPVSSRYLTTLESRLREYKFAGQLLIMQADALVQSVPEVVKKPVYLMNSGPASGPAGAVHLGQAIAKPNIIGIDMGGTSLDIDFVKDGDIGLSNSRWIEDEMCAIKMVDVTSIGAGGGSIAWLDSLNMLRVGPRSSGAEPGPACYGKGGTEPTVTDADLLLGYVPEDYFLGGKIKLDRTLAEKAVGKIAAGLSMSLDEAANAIFSVANHNMADGITEVTTRNGYDVRDFSLLAFGGGGPVHGVFLAEALSIPEVIVPRFSSSFCAWSMFTLDIGRDYIRSLVSSAGKADLNRINGLYREMAEEAVADLRKLGAERKDIKITRCIEMRYQSQFHNVEVSPLPEGEITPEIIGQAVKDFHKKHEAIYRFSISSYEVEIRSLRIIASVAREKIKLVEWPAGAKDPSAALKRTRSCFFGGVFTETSVYDGAKLKYNNVIDGPAVIEETTTTVVIPESFGCRVDKYGNYIIRRK